MSYISVRLRLKPALLACVAGLSLAGVAAPALAQDGAVVDPRLLVEQLVAEGIITRAQADRMIAKATVAPPQGGAALPPIAGGPTAEGQMVPYVPQVVREQIVAQVRQELGSQAQSQGWAKPGETPEWTRRIQLYGDVRVRGEGRFYDDSNFPDFLDFNTINRGAGYHVNAGAFEYENPDFLNTSEDRRRVQLRARVGLRAEISEAIRADIRLATGTDQAPVSTNQTLGAGGTSNYQLWLDRASIRVTPLKGVNVDFGRFANPFWTSDLLYDADLNFDGVAASATHAFGERFSVFGSAGAFPVFNTALNFGSRNEGSFKSTDKYLLAAQAGIEFRPTDSLRLRLASGYFHYDGVQGQFSSPCFALDDVCDTDATRPAFQQFGNTMTPLRNIIPNAELPSGTSPEVQYVGLASDFRLLNLRGQIEYHLSERIGVRLDGDFVKNLAFERSAIAPLALNNFAPIIGTTGGQYDGSDKGWQARLIVGDLGLGFGESGWTAERGSWAAHIAYRRLGSDAVIDGFADSDLGLGGTNIKGWIAGANYGVAHNSVLGLRWMSSDQIAGPPLSIDRLFLDLSTRF